jgi:hypothetical protein
VQNVPRACTSLPVLLRCAALAMGQGSSPFSFFHATATAALASKGPRLTFRTVLVETPSRAAILRMLSRARKASRIRRSISGAIGGWPSCLPRLWLGPTSPWMLQGAVETVSPDRAGATMARGLSTRG